MDKLQVEYGLRQGIKTFCNAAVKTWKTHGCHVHGKTFGDMIRAVWGRRVAVWSPSGCSGKKKGFDEDDRCAGHPSFSSSN